MRRKPYAMRASEVLQRRLKTAYEVGVLQMKQRPRIYYTESQKALMWERWQKGDSLTVKATDGPNE